MATNPETRQYQLDHHQSPDEGVVYLMEALFLCMNSELETRGFGLMDVGVVVRFLVCLSATGFILCFFPRHDYLRRSLLLLQSHSQQ